jgi:hypothetical protein
MTCFTRVVPLSLSLSRAQASRGLYYFYELARKAPRPHGRQSDGGSGLSIRLKIISIPISHSAQELDNLHKNNLARICLPRLQSCEINLPPHWKQQKWNLSDSVAPF